MSAPEPTTGPVDDFSRDEGASPLAGPSVSAGRWDRAMPLIPALFAAYPAVSLYAINQSEVPVRDLARPLLVLFGVTALLWPLFRILARDRDPARAALALSALLLAFFQLDAVMEYLLIPTAVFLTVVSTGTMLLLWEGLCLAAIFALLRLRYPARSVAPAAALAGAFLVLSPTATALWKGAHPAASNPPPTTETEARPVPSPTATAPPAAASTLPDLYCIVLDGYGRQDVLKTLYGVDNEPFLHELEGMGFQVARHSRANYIQTALALDAALNVNYLKANDDRGIDQSVAHLAENRVAADLRQRGFKIVYVPTVFPLKAATSEADVVLDTEPPLTEVFTPLERLILEKTLFRPLMAREHVAFDKHRLRLLAALDDVKTAARMPEPKFVLAHVLAPHPPFVFGPHGEPTYPKEGIFKIGDATDYRNRSTGENYQKGYSGQVQYLNFKVLEMLKAVLSEKKRSAVIVVMGDHGPRRETDWESLERTNVHEAFYNLMAVYAPPSMKSPNSQEHLTLPDEITPINVFREILTDVYGENLPPLPDNSFYSTLSKPYHFVDVTARVAGVGAQEEEPARPDAR